MYKLFFFLFFSYVALFAAMEDTWCYQNRSKIAEEVRSYLSKQSFFPVIRLGTASFELWDCPSNEFVLKEKNVLIGDCLGKIIQGSREKFMFFSIVKPMDDEKFFVSVLYFADPKVSKLPSSNLMKDILHLMPNYINYTFCDLVEVESRNENHSLQRWTMYKKEGGQDQFFVNLQFDEKGKCDFIVRLATYSP